MYKVTPGKKSPDSGQRFRPFLSMTDASNWPVIGYRVKSIVANRSAVPSSRSAGTLLGCAARQM